MNDSHFGYKQKLLRKSLNLDEFKLDIISVGDFIVVAKEACHFDDSLLGIDL
jgi:hypothetical protein